MNTPAADQLRLSYFDYDLPESLIAQEPCSARDRSRLMVLKRGTSSIEHRIFSDLENYLVPGDLLVLNNTKVFPCRLLARKQGGGKAEIFLLSEQGPNLWHALIKGGGAAGRILSVTADVEAELINEGLDGAWSVRFHGINNIRELLPRIGKTPLPPYIKRDPSGTDRERYQTVYAAREGAVAAPTAGLHFTLELLEQVRNLINVGAPDATVAHEIQTRGLAFTPDRELLAQGGINNKAVNTWSPECSMKKI